ncbi:hypothetical protein DFH09DRAFT_1218280 [Mycena vulgaris]|nr:hypothetical protein DFH09DRAFT_1218280 [Mycena vulgaris]
MPEDDDTEGRVPLINSQTPFIEERADAVADELDPDPGLSELLALAVSEHAEVPGEEEIYAKKSPHDRQYSSSEARPPQQKTQWFGRLLRKATTRFVPLVNKVGRLARSNSTSTQSTITPFLAFPPLAHNVDLDEGSGRSHSDTSRSNSGTSRSYSVTTTESSAPNSPPSSPPISPPISAPSSPPPSSPPPSSPPILPPISH